MSNGFAVCVVEPVISRRYLGIRYSFKSWLGLNMLAIFLV